MIVVNALPLAKVRHPLARASALFVSDWSTATGTGDAALRDTGQALPWETLYNTNNILAVVAAPTDDPFTLTPLHTFPSGMTNVLRVNHKDNGSNGCLAGDVHSVNDWAAPQTGETYYYRAYLRVDIANDEGNYLTSAHHPLEGADGSTTSGQWEWMWGSGATNQFAWKMAPIGATFPKSRWIPCDAAGDQAYLLKGKVYRFEWAFTRTGIDTYTILDIRIYDNAGTLLYNKDGVGTSPSGQAVRDASTNLTLAASGTGVLIEDASVRMLLVGTNGSNMRMLQRNTEYSYYGGIMIRNDDWCGAY